VVALARQWRQASRHARVAGPTVAGGVVYVGVDRKVYALDAATGRLRWAFTTGGSAYSRPAVAGGTVYVGSWDYQVYALNVRS
jgi:outer membrane protein assembly factor BamB